MEKLVSDSEDCTDGVMEFHITCNISDHCFAMKLMMRVSLLTVLQHSVGGSNWCGLACDDVTGTDPKRFSPWLTSLDSSEEPMSCL